MERRSVPVSPYSSNERRLADVQQWAAARGPCTPLIDLEPYEACRAAGIVERLRIDPVGSCIDVTIADATSEIVIRWSLPAPASALSAVPGMGVVVEGVAAVAEDGRLVVQDPRLMMTGLPYAS